MYTVKEAAEILDITPRAVTMRCKKSGIKKKGKSYIIPNDVLQIWKSEGDTEVIQKERKEVKEEEEVVYEEFTNEQYKKLQEVIQEYPNLIREIQQYKEEIIYLRNELHSRTKQMDKLINTIDGSIKSLSESNYLQLIDKTKVK